LDAAVHIALFTDQRAQRRELGLVAAVQGERAEMVEKVMP